MKTTLALGTAVAALLATACSQTAQQPTFADDLAQITAFNERYLRSINEEDIATLSSLTTDGHVMLPPNREPVVGKSANDAMNGGAFERYDFSETWTPVETVVDGDLAFPARHVHDGRHAERRRRPARGQRQLHAHLSAPAERRVAHDARHVQ